MLPSVRAAKYRTHKHTAKHASMQYQKCPCSLAHVNRRKVSAIRCNECYVAAQLGVHGLSDYDMMQEEGRACLDCPRMLTPSCVKAMCCISNAGKSVKGPRDTCKTHRSKKASVHNKASGSHYFQQRQLPAQRAVTQEQQIQSSTMNGQDVGPT